MKRLAILALSFVATPVEPPTPTTLIGEPDAGCLIGEYPDCVDPNATTTTVVVQSHNQALPVTK